MSGDGIVDSNYAANTGGADALTNPNLTPPVSGPVDVVTPVSNRTGGNGTLGIEVISAFPDKVTAIRRAIDQLRAVTAEMSKIPETARQEAGSFTRDKSPAPVYVPVVGALKDWTGALAPAATAVVNSADKAADAVTGTFNHWINTDERAKKEIERLGGTIGAIPL